MQTVSAKQWSDMKRREKQQIFLLEDQFRSDFVILDEMKKCRGFIWRYGKWWVVRVDNKPAQYRTSRRDSWSGLQG